MPGPDSSPFGTKQPIAETPVKYLKGVGPKKSEALASVGVRSPLDLLYYFPRRYLDRSRILKIEDAKSALLIPDEVTFVGRIKSLYVKRGGRQFLFVKLTDETGTLKCVWFNGVPVLCPCISGRRTNRLLGKSIDLPERALLDPSGLRPS